MELHDVLCYEFAQPHMSRNYFGNSSDLRLAGMLFTIAASQTAFCADAGKTNGAALKYEQPRMLTGMIYAKDSDRKQPLFRFIRTATRTNSTLTVLREYFYPDGKPAARERVVYEGDELVSYALEDLQTGARGSAQIRAESAKSAKQIIYFQYNKEAGTNSKPQTRSEPLRKDVLMNDMVGPFLKFHWDALSRGETAKCRYIVLPRRETVGFTFEKQSESTWQGRGVVIVKMEPTSPIIAELVEPLFFTIEAEGQHRVLEYTGRTTPKIRAGSRWKDLDAVTVFDWK